MLIINPYKMQWEDGFRKLYPEAIWSKEYIPGHDINIFMWMNNDSIQAINKGTDGKNIVFIRRYELFSFDMTKVNWSNVSSVIMVNDYLAKCFEESIKIKPHVVYNAVDLSKWKFKERKNNKKIAVVGFINQRKNLPLAIQILNKLDNTYELHVAGGVQDGSVMMYCSNLLESLKGRLYFYNELNHQMIDTWLGEMSFILCTSISEGCPNNVIEAMAKGIKPVVHNYPGSKEQFGEYVFDTIDQAIEMMKPDCEYDSHKYRRLIEEKFGHENFARLNQIIEQLTGAQ
jgi:glycosyltransferase involved in cell wall biosynthesis